MKLLFSGGLCAAPGGLKEGGTKGDGVPPKRVAGGVGGGRRNTKVSIYSKLLVAAYKCR